MSQLIAAIFYSGYNSRMSIRIFSFLYGISAFLISIYLYLAFSIGDNFESIFPYACILILCSSALLSVANIYFCDKRFLVYSVAAGMLTIVAVIIVDLNDTRAHKENLRKNHQAENLELEAKATHILDCNDGSRVFYVPSRDSKARSVLYRTLANRDRMADTLCFSQKGKPFCAGLDQLRQRMKIQCANANFQSIESLRNQVF